MRILCCNCSALIEPNPANLCIRCIRSVSNISNEIKQFISLYYCRFCQRFLDPPNTWVQHSLDSPELLKMCLKRIGNFKQVRLVGASFLPTEEHSYRLKIEVKIQSEVCGVIVEETINVEAKIFKNMCPDCHKVEADNSHRAIVQVRQKSRYKKTLLYLEQVIIKHKAVSDCIKIKREKDGIDFFFATPQHAQKFINLVSSYVPCTHKESQHLVSHDTHCNTYDYKYTTLISIVPICKDDLVCLDSSYAKSLGLANNILICSRVTTCIYLLDPFTLRTLQISSKDYYRRPFNAICSPHQLAKYTVVDIEPVDPKKGKALADITVVRQNFEHEGTFIVRSHLGKKLKPGSTVLGFDIKHANINDDNFEYLNRDDLSDILIKQSQHNKGDRRFARRWKLQQLRQSDRSTVNESNYDESELEIFMEDIEESEEMRRNIELHIDPSQIPQHLNELERGIHNIQLSELIRDG